MPEIFIAKIRQSDSETLIFCNKSNFTPVSTYIPNAKSLDDLLKLSKKALHSLKIDLNQKLDRETVFLNLIESQYIFATGFTYKWPEQKLNSISDNDIYKKLYLSKRPFIFIKGRKENLVFNHENIRLRRDSIHTIPEAELVAVFNSVGEVIGHSIGNDVTALDLEKQHPLFQLQGKFYHGSVAVLPLIKLTTKIPQTNLRVQVIRENKTIVDLDYNSDLFIKDEKEIVINVHQMGLTPSGGFLFLGCNADYPKNCSLSPGDNIIISSDTFPMSLENGCQWLDA